MTKKIFFIASMFIFALTANAQSYIEHIQENETGKGKITINESLDLDSIINGIKPIIPEGDIAASDGTGVHTGVGAGNRTAGTANAAAGTRKANGVGHVIKSGEQVNVFSIQVYSGGNSREAKEKAQSIAAQVNAKVPGSGARASFHSPRWVVVTGAYATQEIAQAALRRMKSMGFSQASIFRRSVVKR